MSGRGKQYYSLGCMDERVRVWAVHKCFGNRSVDWANVEHPEEVLNVGCGNGILSGAVNLDSVALPGVSVIHDLNSTPWPFEGGRFRMVVAHHVVEHVKDIAVFMGECSRVLAPGGLVEILTPHYSDSGSWMDPTHLWHLHSSSFLYFEQGHPFNYYAGAQFHCLVDVELAKIWRFLGIEYLVNLASRRPSALWIRRLWENYFSFVIRAKTMQVLCMKPLS